MAGQYSRYFKLINTVSDLIFLNASAVIGFYIKFKGFEQFIESQYLSLLLYSNLAWLTSASILNSYSFNRVARYTNIASAVIKHIVLYILFVEATLNITKSYFFSWTFLTYSYIILSLNILIARVAFIHFLKVYRRKGFNYRKVVIAGYSKISRELFQFFKSHPEHGYRFLGYFDDNPKNKSMLVGQIKDLEDFVLDQDVDEIYCSPYDLKREQIVRLIDFADNNLIRLKFLPETAGFNNKKFKVDFYDLVPIIVLRTIPLDDFLLKSIKRLFDFILSLFVIVFLLSWLLPILAILIKLDSKGPVFFKQQRSGINNDSFWCWKLRSMYTNHDAHSKQAAKGDSRITKIGAFLRKTSLDELPQFFNVLIGNMSIVGPRPHMVKHTEQYAQIIDKYMVRHFIKPGITGLSQVMGYRGDTTESIKMKARVKIDIFYLENWSFLFDIKIIFMTIINIFKGEENAF